MARLNPYIWLRPTLNKIPIHFIKCNTPVTFEKMLWIDKNIQGRFAFSHFDAFIDDAKFVYFEDPKDAMYYELTWS